MNGFQKHGIKHLSASAINLWMDAPDMYCARYLGKHKSGGSAAMTRGIAVEDGVVAALATTATVEDAIQIAHRRFDKSYPIGNENSTKQRSVIAPMIRQSIEALEHLGKPDFEGEVIEKFTQEKVEIKTKLDDGSVVPVIGYLDLVYQTQGLVVDLKSTLRMPSIMSPQHQLQRAIYSKAKGNNAVRFLYVSDKKHKFLECGHVPTVLGQAKVIIRRLNSFLLTVDDADHAMSIVPHNPHTFYWNGAEKLRQKLFKT